MLIASGSIGYVDQGGRGLTYDRATHEAGLVSRTSQPFADEPKVRRQAARTGGSEVQCWGAARTTERIADHLLGAPPAVPPSRW